MSDGLIDPEAIPLPEANVYELQSAAAGMKTDGEGISQAGADISSSWAGLQGVYSAPEAETLFVAVDPVPTKGEDTDQALNTAARALEDFAETAQRIRGELIALRAQARELVAEIRSDEDWNSSEHPFDFVSEKGREHDGLLGKVNALVQEYQQAERDCANTITRTFGGTTFIGGDLEGTAQPAPGEVLYGFDEPLENVATPWGTPQGTDYYWTMDAALAAWDVVRGGAEDLGGMVGAYGDPGWFTGDWGANAEAYWGDALVGMGAWAGVYNPQTDDWVGGFREGVEVYTNARLDAVHGFFPWTELEERPGYAFGTLGTNAALIGAGVALTATGAGAVVGVPLTVSRVMRIFGGVGDGSGPHLSGDDGAESGRDRNGSGSGVHGNGAHSSSPSAPGEGAFSSDGEWAPSDIEDMNTALSDLEAAHGPPPAPERGPDARPENTAPEPRPEPVVPDRSPDTATTDDAPQQHTGQEQKPDPTAQEIDQAFAEIARDNEDLADRMDRQDGGRMADLDPDAAWTINPAQTTTGGGDGPGDGSRIPVTPDGAELRADDEVTDNTDNGGPAPQPDRDENPVTIHEAAHAEPEGLSPSGGSTSASGGGDDNGSGDHGGDRPGEVPDPHRDKKIKRANELEDALRNSGLSENDISQLRGENERDGRAWQRVASAVLDNQFPDNKKLRLKSEMQPAAARFALEGASNPFEFAYRYEYFKGIFDQESKRIERELRNELDLSTTQINIPNQSKKDAAALILEQGIDMEALLESDRSTIRSMRGEAPRVNGDLPDEEIGQIVRSLAGEIGMGPETSAAYHTRKHQFEVPSWERTENPIEGYLNSAEITIREGTITNFNRLDDGGIHLTFERIASPAHESTDLIGTRKVMIAQIYIRDHTGVVMSTYGSPN